MAAGSALFEDIFDVRERDPDGKYFDRVSRYKCKSELYGADVIIDINSDIYPLELGQRYTLRITQTLVADVAAQKEEYDPDLFNGVKASEMDNFEYVMHGKVYKLEHRTEEGSTRAVASVSFGGLLMQLIADHTKLNRFEVDSMVYLLIRKAN